MCRSGLDEDAEQLGFSQLRRMLGAEERRWAGPSGITRPPLEADDAVAEGTADTGENSCPTSTNGPRKRGRTHRGVDKCDRVGEERERRLMYGIEI